MSKKQEFIKQKVSELKNEHLEHWISYYRFKMNKENLQIAYPGVFLTLAWMFLMIIPFYLIYDYGGMNFFHVLNIPFISLLLAQTFLLFF